MPDVVSSASPDGPRGRWPTVVSVVVVVMVVLGLVARWADAREKQHEFKALLAAITNAQATAAAAQAVVFSTRTYTMPLLVSSSSATVRAGLAELIDQSAAKGATQLRRARVAISDVRVLPWHHQLRAARARYLDYLDAQLTALDDVARGADLAELPRAANDPALPVAGYALENAAPTEKQRQDADAALFQRHS